MLIELFFYVEVTINCAVKLKKNISTILHKFFLRIHPKFRPRKNALSQN